MDNLDKQNIVSFKFSKTNEKKKSLISSLGVPPTTDNKQSETEKNFIVSLERNDSKPTISKPVIPLPKKTPIVNLDENVDSLTKEAMEELMKDANKVETGEKSILRIPLISRTKLEGVEMDENDYEEMPIGEFGKAMLRGMGWKDEDVGEPIVEIRRGFSSFLPADKSKSNKDEELDLRKGSYCMFISGKTKGKYGKVIDDDGLRMIVEVASSGDMINTCATCLKAVTKREHDKSKQYINSSKYDEYLADLEKKREEVEKKHKLESDKIDKQYDKNKLKEEYEDKKDSKHHDNDTKRSKINGSSSHSDRKRAKDPAKGRESSPPSHKRKANSSGDGLTSHKSTVSDHNSADASSKEKSKNQMWLHPNLVVRIIDKKFKGGKHFKEKVVIEDVIKPFVCNCRASGHNLLEGLHQNQLETVIPREVPSIVMILRGKNKFQLARLLHKDKEDCKVMVNLVNDQSESLNLDFDDVCHFEDSML